VSGTGGLAIVSTPFGPVVTLAFDPADIAEVALIGLALPVNAPCADECWSADAAEATWTAAKVREVAIKATGMQRGRDIALLLVWAM
jgi:hypothetical protein